MRRMVNPALRTVSLLFLLAASLDGQVPAGTGTITFVDSASGRNVVVFYVKPEDYQPSDPPVLVLHGMNRNPWDYRDAWIGLAREHHLFVVVPYFREVDYPGTVGYNLGNVFQSETALARNPPEEWSYRLPEVVFDELRRLAETTAPGYLAFGHSAGSQFLHRKACLAPDGKMLLAVAANAGWYTFPTIEEEWPYGYGGTGLKMDDFRRYLASPLVILLGDQDNDPQHESLRRTEEAMRQGRNRLERGHAFYQAGKKLAEQLEVPFKWKIAEVPGVGHDNARMAPAAARLMACCIKARRVQGEEN